MPSLNSDYLAAHSLTIENLLRHGFLFELCRELLLRQVPRRVTILNAEVDDSGVDLVLTCGKVTRHIQMKTLNKTHAPNPYAIARALFDLRGGCVIWTCYDIADLRPTQYHFLGNSGNEVLGDAGQFPKFLKRKAGMKVPREGYVGVRTRDANHKNLGIQDLADLLFPPVE
jgi:hypothetical protein